MNPRPNFRPAAALAAFSFATAALLVPSAAFGADADGAQTLARQNNCFKCHAVDKDKVGPAWKDVAAKYKGKPDAEAKLYTHLTTGPKDHPIVKAKSPDDTKNLVSWILSL